MDSAIWAKVHGATTHFPLALVVCSGAFDAAAFALAGRPGARGLQAAGYWTMVLGALGAMPAVFSGLIMTKGSVLGHGALRMHHLLVWPAFALIVGLAAWRVLASSHVTRAMFAAYLVGVGFAAALLLAAGYWGGELMIAR